MLIEYTRLFGTQEYLNCFFISNKFRFLQLPYLDHNNQVRLYQHQDHKLHTIHYQNLKKNDQFCSLFNFCSFSNFLLTQQQKKDMFVPVCFLKNTPLYNFGQYLQLDTFQHNYQTILVQKFNKKSHYNCKLYFQRVIYL